VAEGLLEYPQYTRPRDFRGMAAPEVLLSGDHAAIAKWRAEQAEARTRLRRSDLLNGRQQATGNREHEKD
jgi:tRNA (guanine37-N1)-methyltransferase